MQRSEAYPNARKTWRHWQRAAACAAVVAPDGTPALKLHSFNSPTVLNTVTGYGDGYIEINKVRYEYSVLVMPGGAVVPWDLARFEDLTPEHFTHLLELGAEVVVFGTGNRPRFLHPHLAVPLTEKRIGVDAMDLQAAGRTYNILMLEGRKVAAILLIGHA